MLTDDDEGDSNGMTEALTLDSEIEPSPEIAATTGETFSQQVLPGTQPAPPIITVIICTFNRYNILADATASIELQDYPADRYELLIIDNSDDIDAGKRFFDGFEITCKHRIIREAKPGLSRARNVGVNAAAGDLVAFVDDDARASPGWLSGIVRTFAENERAGIVGGPVRPIWCEKRPEWLHTWLEGYLTILDRGGETRALGEDEWLVGTNIAFRKEAIKAVGMFPENIGRIKHLLLSNEEIIVSKAVRELGYDVVYNPEIVTYHRVHPERANRDWLRRRVFWQVISDLFSTGCGDQFDAQRDIEQILEFLAKLAPKQRGIVGLFLDIDDAELFHAQTMALRSLVRLLANDARDWSHYLKADAE